MTIWTGPRSWAAIGFVFISLNSGTAHAAALPGSIQAEDFDAGGEGVGYHDTTRGNSGGQYRTNDDVDIVRTGDSFGGYDVNGFQTGEWLAYTVTVVQGGAFDFSLRVATTYSDSAFHLEVDGRDVTGRVAVGASTGGWKRYRWANAPRITLTAGTHVVKVVADRQYFNLNVVRALTAASSSPYTGTPAPVPGVLEAENYDLGGEGVGYHDLVAGNAGGQYRLYEAVDIVPSTDSAGGLYDVNNFQTGEWLAYTVGVTQAGGYDLAVRVASAFDTSALRVLVNGLDVANRVAIPNTTS